MGKKHRADQIAEPVSTRRWVVTGIAVVLAAIGIGIGIAMLLGIAGGDGPASLPKLPSLGAEEPVYPRSAAADLLANVSFEEMTPEQLDLVRAETTKAYANAEFRATSPAVMGLDVVRRDGHTRATRQYRTTDSPGGDKVLYQTIVFYCPGPEGFIDLYRADITPLITEVKGDRKPDTSQPFDRDLSGLDWTSRKDLGFDEIDGHRVHGVEMPWWTIDRSRTIPWQVWFDVETAQLRLRRQAGPNDGDLLRYALDWHAVPKIETVEKLGKPPCYDDIYPPP